MENFKVIVKGSWFRSNFGGTGLRGRVGFKIAVLRSKMNSLKGNSSNFESSLLANCEGLAHVGRGAVP